MDIEILSAFILGRIVLSGTPGPGVLASVTKAVSDSFEQSVFFLSGIVLCNIFFLLLAIYGVTQISKILGELFLIIKILGGIYLIVLGLRLFRKRESALKTQPNTKINYKNFIEGFILTAGNPAPILFYAGFVSSMINGQQIKINDVLLMISIIIIIAYLITGSYCYFGSLSKDFLVKNGFNNYINKIAGIILSIIGCYIAIKS